MTAPDPRLNEIQARLDKTPPDHGHTQSWLPAADVRYLLAELRKAHEALELAWEQGYGKGYSDHVWSQGHEPRDRNPYRAAVAAAKGDEQ